MIYIATIWRGLEFVGSFSGPFLSTLQWAKAQQARNGDYSANISPAGVEV